VSQAKSSVILPTDKKRVGTATFPTKTNLADGSVRWNWLSSDGAMMQSGCSTASFTIIESAVKDFRPALERLAKK